MSVDCSDQESFIMVRKRIDFNSKILQNSQTSLYALKLKTAFLLSSASIGDNLRPTKNQEFVFISCYEF